MGGSAFNSRPNLLPTPRMPPDVYLAAKSRCHALLLEHFTCVASPIDSPGKTDYGDIDIFVCYPKDTTPLSERGGVDALGRIIGAVDVIYHKNDGIAGNFAIPWLEDSTCVENEPTPKDYIQVDVRHCASLEALQWILFKHAHGDFWNYVGSMIRPFGLTVDDFALWVRVPEIEDKDKKLAKVFLSAEPALVLDFLGLPVESYWDQTFESVEAQFEYAARCNLMYVPNNKPQWDITELKANDRIRARKRPGFKRWIEEFIPNCREQGRFATRPASRQEVTERALERFQVREEYNARRDAFLRERQRDIVWNDVIKGQFPKPNTTEPQAIMYRSCLVRAFKAIILENSTEFGTLFDTSLVNNRGFYDLDGLGMFLKDNEAKVGEAALRKHNGAYQEHLRQKGRLVNE